MDTVVTINGVAYNSAARAGASFNAFDELTLDLEGYSELVWTIQGVGPLPPFSAGAPVTFSADGNLRFVGDFQGFSHAQSPHGWAITFRAIDFRKRADRITIVASDGTGNAVYNRPQNDPDYLASDAGLTVGAIITRILTIAENASRLNAAGIGGYTSSSPWTLPATTVTDLAALTVVPPHVVMMSGEALFDELAQLVRQNHPKFNLYIQPNGTIRCINLFTMTSHSLVVPGEASGVTPDPIGWPNLSCDVSDCYTSVELRGVDIKQATGSTRDTAGGTTNATLVPGWDPTYDSSWTLDDFQQPKDSTDAGTIVSGTLTTGGCSIQSSDATHYWVANFWNDANRQGWIELINPAGTGITISDVRKITSCGALTAGGTTTITWDSGDPLDSLSYTQYRIRGNAGGKNDVGRLFLFREPSSGATGVNTWVGSHLLKRFPRPVGWGNNGKSGGTGVGGVTSTPVAIVRWSSTGSPPFYEFPLVPEIVPSLGGIRFAQPVWMTTALKSDLQAGEPATYAKGKYYEVAAMVPYNRGGLSMVKPTTGYEGTAYTAYGIQRRKLIHIDGFEYNALSSNMAILAQEYLDCLKDAVFEGSIVHHDIPAGFDPLVLGYSLSLTVSGATSPWDGVNLPVRKVSIQWPQGTGEQHRVTFHVSNRRRPFQGLDLYVHPLPSGEVGQSSGAMPFGTPYGIAAAMPDISGAIGFGPRAFGPSGLGSEAGMGVDLGSGDGKGASDGRVLSTRPQDRIAAARERSAAEATRRSDLRQAHEDEGIAQVQARQDRADQVDPAKEARRRAALDSTMKLGDSRRDFGAVENGNRDSSEAGE